MTDYGSRDIPLSWDVFVTPGVPVVDNDLPPGEKQRLWPPISSTLISGEGHAVLVDAFITVAQTRALVDWVVASGKNLTTIYATHGHGDHFFGATTVLDRFPRARFVATPGVVKISTGNVVVTDVTTATITWSRPHVALLATRVNSSYSQGI